MSDVTLGDLLAGLKDTFTKAPTLENLPKDIMAYRATQDAKRSHASDHLYITDFAYRPCARRLAYYLLQPEIQDPPKDPKVLFDMDAGTAIHEWFQDRVLGPMGLLEGEWECSRCGVVQTGKRPTAPCMQEIQILDLMEDKWVKTSCKATRMQWKFKEQHIELNLHGIKVTGRPDGKLVVTKGRLLEIKSTEHEKFEAIEAPKDYHVFQASVYGAHLGYEEVVILYVDRNYWWNIKAFVVPVDPEAIKTVETYCETIRFLLDNEDPLRAVGICTKRSATKAKECGVRDICFPLKRKRKSGK